MIKHNNFPQQSFIGSVSILTSAFILGWQWCICTKTRIRGSVHVDAAQVYMAVEYIL